MLEFLGTGKALSVLAAIGIIGFVSGLAARSLYKRLLKDSENMVMTRNKNLKLFRQKLENTYRFGQNRNSTAALADRIRRDFCFLRIPLHELRMLPVRMMLLGLLAGGLGTFFSYWYRLDSYYIILYASAGLLTALFLAFADSVFENGERERRLENVLLEYAARPSGARLSPETAGTERERTVRENLSRERNSRAQQLLQTVRCMKDGEEEAEPGQRRETEEKEESRERPAEREIRCLRQSLEQIAASREKPEPESERPDPMSSEEIRLLGEIMREYMRTGEK